MGPRTHIGQRELDRVGLLSVKDRVIQMKMNHVYKIFHGTAPDYLNAHFTRVTSVHSYSTRGTRVAHTISLSLGLKVKLAILFSILQFVIGIFCPIPLKKLIIYLISKLLSKNTFLNKPGWLSRTLHIIIITERNLFLLFQLHVFAFHPILDLVFVFAHACLSDAAFFCHIRTPVELSLFEKVFLGYPWYSWLCISHFHTLQYLTLVLCAVDFKMFLIFVCKSIVFEISAFIFYMFLMLSTE